MNLARASLLALVLCAAVAASAQDFAALEKIYLDDALKTHDLDAHAQSLIEVISARPDKPEGWLALQRLVGLRRDLADQKPLHAMLHEFAAGDFKRCGVYADSYAEAYCELARDFLADTSWHAVARRWGGLTAASWIGPFAESGPSAHDDAFPPEVNTNFGRTATGAFGPVQWTPVRPVEDLDGEIDLGNEARWLGCGYYVAFSLVAAADREVTFKPRFNGPGRVWLNGRLLVDVDARAKDYPQLWLDAQLQRGRNLLMVKLSALSPLNVRMRTRDGMVPEGIVCEAPTAATASVAASVQIAAPLKLSPPELAGLGDKQPASARQMAALLLGRAYAFKTHGLVEASSELVEQALAAAPDEPLVRLEWLDMLESSPLYGSGERRRQQVATLADLLTKHPGLVPAHLKQSALLVRDERWQDAQQALNDAAKAAPGNWRVALAEAEMFQRAGWRAQWLQGLRSAQKLSPHAIPVLQGLSRYWNWRSLPFAQMEFDRAILARMPGHRDALATLISTLLRAAQPEEALKLARLQATLDPVNDYAQSRLATALLANTRLDEACEVYERMAARTSRPEYAWQDAAKASLQFGDAARAAKYLQRVVTASPGEHASRRQLDRLQGRAENFWKPYATSFEDALKHDVGAAQFPRADSALVLDEMVQLVYADGSSQSYVHQVRKILTQQGVDERGREDINGELVLARTIRPDGSVLEPITYSGNQVEFPGVAIGCYIETAWLTNADANPWRTLMGDRFYFSDQKLSEPFAISRFVLVAPAAMPLSIRVLNMHADDFTQQSADGVTTRVWDVRRPQHPQAEDFSPSSLETIPWVEIVQPRDWRRKARETAETGLGIGRKITGLVRKQADALVQGCTTDEQRARKIYAWVNANLTTQGESFHPHQSIKALAGDRQELFVALCLAAGVKVGFAAADYAPEYKPAIEDDLPSLNWAFVRREDFPLFLVVVAGDDGAPIYLDLGDRLRPFGFLSARRCRAPVLVWRDGSTQLAQLPATDANTDRFENRASIQLAADGSATIEGSISIFGDRAWGLKDGLRNQPADEMQSQLEGELAGLYPGFEIESFTTPAIDDPGTPLVRTFKGKVSNLARAQGGTLALALPMESLGQLLSALVSSTERRTALLLNFDLHQQDEVRIAAPAGWRFKSIPAGLVYPTVPMLYSLQFELKDGALVIRRGLALGPGRIEPSGYGQLTRQVKKISEAEEVTIELEKAP